MKESSLHTSTFIKQGLEEFASYDANRGVWNSFDDNTLILFGALQNAYNYFKKELFNDKLPPVILTLNRKVRSMGYYMPYAWLDKSESIVPEININPDILQLPAIEVMQTLVHEMCHHFQQFFGKPGKKGYHNKEFSRIMFSKGLMCSNTGMPGGKVTGRKMADYVIEGGSFDLRFIEMPKEFQLPFTSVEKVLVNPVSEDLLQNESVKRRNKTKYSCSKCNANVWGKPDMNIYCGNCNKPFKPM